MTVDEARDLLDRSIRAAAVHARTGEGTQAQLDELLERRHDVVSLHAFAGALEQAGVLT